MPSIPFDQVNIVVREVVASRALSARLWPDFGTEHDARPDQRTPREPPS